MNPRDFVSIKNGDRMTRSVPTVYVKIIQTMYKKASTKVKIVCGESEDFTVK